MLIVQSPSQLSRYEIAYSLLGAHRWTGCKCKVKKTFFGKGRYACEDANCPCVLADRECDPELCKGCKCKRFVAGFPSYSSTYTDMGFTLLLFYSTRRCKSLLLVYHNDRLLIYPLFCSGFEGVRVQKFTYTERYN